MPHKHKRLKSGHNEAQQFNLPPTAPTTALPVKHQKGAKINKAARSKVSNGYKDDTPRAFAQLMQLRKTGKGYKGLDNGPKNSNPRKRNHDDADHRDEENSAVKPVTAPEEDNRQQLKILPGERLSDYAARVDQALPVSGLISKHVKADGLSEQRKTKHEKKLQRLVNNWKAEEARRIERAQEEWDEAEEDEDEHEALWDNQATEMGNTKKARKRARGKREDDEEWATLSKEKRQKPRVFDVAQAPPQFSGRAPREFKGKDVPSEGNSVRRREMLSETRMDVIKRYREMMQAKRGE